MEENTIKPVSPEDLKNQTEHAIHPSMLKAINILLTRFDGYSVRLYQDEIVTKFMELEPTVSRNEIFEKGYLEFLGLYRREGWEIEVDRPGYNESYETNYTFRIKK